ncbi:hypothetical protein JCM6882_006535 [Rhodosporidiobolus microsporus]
MLPHDPYALPPSIEAQQQQQQHPSSSFSPPAPPAPTALNTPLAGHGAAQHQQHQQHSYLAGYAQQPPAPPSGVSTWSSAAPSSSLSSSYGRSIAPSFLSASRPAGGRTASGGSFSSSGSLSTSRSPTPRASPLAPAPAPSQASLDSLWAWSDALGGAPMFGSSGAARNAFNGSAGGVVGTNGYGSWGMPPFVAAASFPGGAGAGGAAGAAGGAQSFHPPTMFSRSGAASAYALPVPPPGPAGFHPPPPSFLPTPSQAQGASLPYQPAQPFPPPPPLPTGLYTPAAPLAGGYALPSPVPTLHLRDDGTIPFSTAIAAARNPADPYVPADPASSAVSRSVLVAAAYRKNLATIDLTGRRRGSNAGASPPRTTAASVASSSSSPSSATSPSTSTSSSTPSSSLSPVPPPSAPPPPPPASKPLRGKPFAALSIACSSPTCSNAGNPVCRVALRGGCVDSLLPRGAGADPASYSFSFLCVSCAPLPPSPPKKAAAAGGGEAAGDPLAGEANYQSMLSGAVDRYLGNDPAKADTRPRPAGWGKVVTGFVAVEGSAGSEAGGGAGEEGAGGEGGGKAKGKGKGRKRAASALGPVVEGVLVCDVCNRDVATGRLTLAPREGEKEGKPVTATAEVVCAHCDERYVRCSDCGGGGAGKGVGRWRCKELFVDGRKTCLLLHGRPPPVTTMEFDVHLIPSLPAVQLDSIIRTCRTFFFRTAFLTAAIPELIEGPSPIARSFDELENVAVDLWSVFEDVIRGGDDQGTYETKRYLAFYWAPPPSQSKKSQPAPAAPSALSSSQKIVREDKVLAGLILAEHDLPTGNLHLCFHLPFSVGEAGLALGRLTQILCARAQKELDEVNEERRERGEGEWPRVRTVWTVRLNKRDSRLMSRATRRDWTSLDEYLLKYPDVDPRAFPPYRKLYLTPDTLYGWWIYASRYDPEGEAADGGEGERGEAEKGLGEMEI